MRHRFARTTRALAALLAALIALPPAALAQAPAKPGEGLITQAQYQKASTQVLNEMVQ